MKGMKPFLWLVALLAAGILSSLAGAQPPDTLWTHTYGGSYDDYAYSIQQTPDGGFIVAGTWDESWYNSDGWLFKIDSLGNLQWSRTYGGGDHDIALCVRLTNDGNYIFAGRTNTPAPGGYNGWLVKTDTLGNILWERLYDSGDLQDCITDVELTSDGGYILAGCTQSFSGGNRDAWIVKTDSLGRQQWSTLYGGNTLDMACMTVPTAAGDYIVAGETTSFGAGGYDGWLIKLDAAGNVLWDRTYGGPANDDFDCIHPTDDGGYIISGETHSYGAGNGDYWLVKLDADFNITWQNTFGLASHLEWSEYSDKTADGGYVICGIDRALGGPANNDIYIVKTDPQGNLFWQTTIGGPANDGAMMIQQTSDGSYIVAGSTANSGAGYADAWVLRWAAGPLIPPPRLSIELTPENPPIVIPASGGSFQFNVTLSNDTSYAQTFSAWCSVEYHSGVQHPVLGPFTFTFGPGFSLTRMRTQTVPADAPAGEYIYWGYVGPSPWIVVDRDSFSFVKEGATADWPGLEGWSCTGEPFPGEVTASSQPTAYSLISVSPNPFNPTTVIRYQIQDARQVSLRVYDTTGRLITVLVEGWQQAGAYEATFDGSKLASGMYIYRLIASGSGATPTTMTGKMVLLK